MSSKGPDDTRIMNLLKLHSLNGFATITAAIFSGLLLLVWFLDSGCLRPLPWYARYVTTFSPKLSHFVRLHEISNATQNEWLRFPKQANFTATLLRRLDENGTLTCHGNPTAKISVAGLGRVLEAGIVHRFTITAYGETGKARCSGGDYYETDLLGPNWRSRPPVEDLGNGSYVMSLQVDPRLTGDYRLKIFLLFGNFNGLHLRPQKWVRQVVVLDERVRFIAGSRPAPPLRLCRGRDYAEEAWAGRWTRGWSNQSCEMDESGRFGSCLGQRGERCEEPWCEGPPGVLESNGWVYSAHCRFRIFGSEEAWKCLNGRWLFFWGDSNHVDSIRNMLNFVLGLWNVSAVPRRFDGNFSRGSDSVRITNFFNGHWNETLNYQGLHSLSNEGFRNEIARYFSGTRVPDFVVMNSGLHDAAYWRNTRLFAGAAEYAAEFWNSLMEVVESKGIKRPEVLYRNTIATGGYARSLWYNPQKMEAYNRIVLEKFEERRLLTKIVDGFDLTFAWHYDNNCSDGVHYGRAPARSKWLGGQIGHQYFVDLMLVHILLNAICLA